MQSFPMASFLTFFGFLLACTGCCGGLPESFSEEFQKGFEQGFEQSYDKSFKDAYRVNFVGSCIAEITNMTPEEATQMCNCTADLILAANTPAQLTELDANPNSDASQKVFTDAVTTCMAQLPSQQ